MSELSKGKRQKAKGRRQKAKGKKHPHSCGTLKRPLKESALDQTDLHIIGSHILVPILSQSQLAKGQRGTW